jgi:hypothetical protein
MIFSNAKCSLNNEHVGSVFIGGVMREDDVAVLKNAKLPCKCTPAEERRKLSYCT